MKNKSEIIKAAKRKYHQEYRKKNPDKVKAYNEAYWLKKAKEMGIEATAEV